MLFQARGVQILSTAAIVAGASGEKGIKLSM